MPDLCSYLLRCSCKIDHQSEKIMLVQTEGIILKRIKYSDTSVIIHILTADHGKVSVIVNGVRKAKSRMNASYFQPMNLIQFSFFKKNNSTLYRIKEVAMSYYYQQLNLDILRGSMGVYLAEIVQRSVREKEDYPNLYAFLKSWYQYLDAGEDVGMIHIWALIQISKILGFGIGNDQNEVDVHFNLLEGVFVNEEEYSSDFIVSKEWSDVIQQLNTASLDGLKNIRMSRKDKYGLLSKLEYYFSIHVDGFGNVQSLDVLRQVMDV